MSLEQRVALMEKQLRIQGDFLQKVGAAIEERQGKDQATLNFSKILMESVQGHETRIKTLADALTQHQVDLSLVTLVVYFLLQTLEQIEYVVRVGTADAIMTSVEKSGDVKSALYYELFQVLREASVETG
ncbi:hypothetical protein N2600_04300 [Rhizobium sp. WSM1274]|uniref:hypothetical protein n=1 Tax=Rhizobium sp. WSM1274 TaxID=3138254 RepID=UPI0021A8077A|nr:hypothetical protein [Rhizobium leguminosarum]UWU29197.1 hypothetical protein N2600_04300 [Rhizobium leguminosarum bv. viciae]